MTGTEFVGDVGIVLGALIGVFDQQADGGSGGHTFENAGQDSDLVRLAALRGMS